MHENETHKLYWDREIITNKTVPHNRPDITLVDKSNKTTYLIDIAVPNTNNIQTTYTTKITKYQDLRHEVRDIWGMEKIFIIPLVISANKDSNKNSCDEFGNTQH